MYGHGCRPSCICALYIHTHYTGMDACTHDMTIYTCCTHMLTPTLIEYVPPCRIAYSADNHFINACSLRGAVCGDTTLATATDRTTSVTCWFYIIQSDDKR